MMERTLKPPPPRDAAIALRVLNGATYSAAAKEYGVTTERARQITSKACWQFLPEDKWGALPTDWLRDNKDKFVNVLTEQAKGALPPEHYQGKKKALQSSKIVEYETALAVLTGGTRTDLEQGHEALGRQALLHLSRKCRMANPIHWFSNGYYEKTLPQLRRSAKEYIPGIKAEIARIQRMMET